MSDPSAHTFSDPSLQPTATAGGHDEVDPDLAPAGQGIEALTDDGPAAAPGDLLAQAEEAMLADLTKPPLVLEVAGRAGFTVEYDVNIPEPDLRLYQTRATSKRRGDAPVIDGLVFACILVANRARAIRFQGAVIEDDGSPRLFGSRTMKAIYKVSDSRGAVRKFLGDPGTDAHAEAILEASGYGEAAKAVDPTPQL